MVETVSVNGIRIAYAEDGPANGPPLVMSHSLSASQAMWEPQLPALTDRYRVIRIDTRGHGSSDAPAGEYTLEGLADDVLAVADALNKMERLIDDLLSLARQGEVVGETTPVDVAAVARRAWDTVETEDATLERATATVEADDERLAELLGNLFRNSVEHGARRTSGRSPPGDSVEHGSASSRPAADDAVEHGDTSGGVTIRIGPLDGERGFYVEDDGPGVPEEKRQEVFEAGESTNPQGTGFGLSIVKRIAEAHGWEVDLERSFDGGARFEFTNVR